MLKNLRTAVVAAATAGALLSSAALASTVEVTSRATILQAFTLEATKDLQFGDIFSPSTEQTLTVSAGGVATPSEGLVLGSQVQPAAAQFTIQGTANRSVTVLLPNSDQLTGPGAAMALSAFTSDAAGGRVTLDESGTASVNVGATLTINADQAAGAYVGTFDVTVAYE